MQYRRDIDGLRAIAVLPVVLFHAGFEAFSGGFVGVDIFFVISGYLICSILLREIEQQKFSIGRFYQRRARRILPALTAVVVVSSIAAYWILLPRELFDYAESVIATMLFVPNVLFFSSTGYFGLQASSTPMLHMWSLGVEEQFYIVFPILLFVFSRLGGRKGAFWLLLIGAVVSFALNVHSALPEPELTFYLPHTRAWELLVGALLAFRILPNPESRVVRELTAVVGALALLLAIFLIDEQKVFPGYWALLPVLGAAAIIYAGDGGSSLIARILSHPMLVGVGLISYSLYLWHWPVAVFGEMLLQASWLPYAIVAVSIALAIGSYYFVEQPFRKRRVAATPGKLWGFSLISVLILVGGSWQVMTQSGYPQRFAPEVHELLEPSQYSHQARECHHWRPYEYADGQYCTFGNMNSATGFAFVGDSHADALRPAFTAAARQANMFGVQLTSPGCRPLRDVIRPQRDRCARYLEIFLDIIQQNPRITTVFLHGYWRLSYDGFGYRNKSFVILDSDSTRADIADNPQVFDRGFRKFVDALVSMGKRVVVLGGVPEVGFNPREYAARFLHLQGERPTLKLEARPGPVDHYLANTVADLDHPYVLYHDLAQDICPAQHCGLFMGSHLRYRDGDHISLRQSRALAPVILDLLPTQ